MEIDHLEVRKSLVEVLEKEDPVKRTHEAHEISINK